MAGGGRPAGRPDPAAAAALVEALLRAETLDAADAYRAAGVPSPPQPNLPTQTPNAIRH